MSKGIVFSSDLIAAIFILFITIAMIYATWDSLIGAATDDRKNMEATAMRITDLMVKTPGYPDNWDATNVETIGLVNWDRKISEEKLNAFISMDYNTTRRMFGYNYRFRLLRSNITKGQVSEDFVSVRRIIYHNGEDILELDLSR